MRTIQEIKSDLSLRKTELEATRGEAAQLLAKQTQLEQTIKNLEVELAGAISNPRPVLKEIRYTPTAAPIPNPICGITRNFDLLWTADPKNALVGTTGHYVAEYPRIKVPAPGTKLGYTYKSGMTDEWTAKLDRGLAKVEELGKTVRYRGTYQNSPVGQNGSGDDVPLEVMLHDMELIGPVLKRRRKALGVVHKGKSGDWGEQEFSLFDTHLAEPQRRINAAMRKWYDGFIADRLPWHLLIYGFKSPEEARAAKHGIQEGAFASWWQGTFKLQLGDIARKSEAELRAFIKGIGVDIEIMERRTPIKMNKAQFIAEIMHYGATLYNGNSPGRDQLPDLGISMAEMEEVVGYHFVAQGAKIPERVMTGQPIEFEMWGYNRGSGAPLRDYKLALCLWPVGNGNPVFLPLEGNPYNWQGNGATWKVSGTPKAPLPGRYYTFLDIYDPLAMQDSDGDGVFSLDYRYRIGIESMVGNYPMVKPNSRLNDIGHVLEVF